MKTALIATISVLSILSVLYLSQNNDMLLSNDDERPTIKQYETCRNNKCNEPCPKGDRECGNSAYYYGNCVFTNANCLEYEDQRADATLADDALPDSWYLCQQECGVNNDQVVVASYPILECYLECGDYEEVME